MNTTISVFLLIAISAIASADWNNYSGLEKKPCENYGSICSNDCTRILACTQIGEEPTEFKTCNKNIDGHAYCKEGPNGASCSADVPVCDSSNSVDIICGGFGEFPHPFLPQGTIRCLEANLKPYKICHCPEDTFVNTDSIVLPCNHLSPDYPSVQCEYAGQEGQITNHYGYICSDEGIYVFGGGRKFYWGGMLNSSFANNKNCVDNPSSATTTETTITDTTTDDPVTSTTSRSDTSTSSTTSDTTTTVTTDPTTTTTKPSEIQCHYERELILDPIECHSYYFCDDNLVPQHRRCSNGYYFHKQIHYCWTGDCVNQLTI